MRTGEPVGTIERTDAFDGRAPKSRFSMRRSYFLKRSSKALRASVGRAAAGAAGAFVA